MDRRTIYQKIVFINKNVFLIVLHHFFYFKTTPYIDRDYIKSLVKIGGVVVEKKWNFQTEKWTFAYYNIEDVGTRYYR